MVIMVLAGAVAVAMAPRIRAKSQLRLKISFNSRVTSTPAARASLRVMTTIRFPVRRSTSFLKNFPMPKAIKARARSLTKLMEPMICFGTKFRQQGPIRIPARIYPLTLGMFRVLVSLVMINPENRITESTRRILVSSFNWLRNSIISAAPFGKSRFYVFIQFIYIILL